MEHKRLHNAPSLDLSSKCSFEKIAHVSLIDMELKIAMKVGGALDRQLPLTRREHLVKEAEALDLNASDLIACTVKWGGRRERRFLVIDPVQFVLVEPEVRRIGWGVVKFADLVQDVEVAADKEDSRSLAISIRKCGARQSQSEGQSGGQVCKPVDRIRELSVVF